MDRKEAESVIRLFTEIQTCPDKRTAFIKGVLYGLGFANADKREPNWLIIRKLIEEGNDPVDWLEIEKSVLGIYEKAYHKHIKLWLSMSKVDDVALRGGE